MRGLRRDCQHYLKKAASAPKGFAILALELCHPRTPWCPAPLFRALSGARAAEPSGIESVSHPQLLSAAAGDTDGAINARWVLISSLALARKSH